MQTFFLSSVLFFALALPADARDLRFSIEVVSGKSETCYVTGGEGLNIRKSRWMGGDRYKMKAPRDAVMNTTVVCTYPDGRTKVSTAHRALFGPNQTPLSVIYSMPKNIEEMRAYGRGVVVRRGNQYTWSDRLPFTWVK